MRDEQQAVEELDAPHGVSIQDPEITRVLKERVKELDCLYGISAILKDNEMDTPQAIRRIINIIPKAWQHDDIASARILLKGQEFTTDNYMPTQWSQTSRIQAGGNDIGELEVCYLEKKEEEDEGPFLAEERKLIDAVAGEIGNFISLKDERAELAKEREKLVNGALKQVGAGTGPMVRGASEHAVNSTGHDPDEVNDVKQDWEIIIDLLIKTDPRTLLRITRKMMYQLYKRGDHSIESLVRSLCPPDSEDCKWCGINIPNPRQDLEALKRIQEGVFRIAKDTLPPNEISAMFHQWLREDKARALFVVSQKRGIPLVEIADELHRFWDTSKSETILAPEDDVAIRAALIRRFFTGKLGYINNAKRFIEIKDFVELLDHVVGPAQGEGKLGGKISGLYLAQKIIEREMEKDPDLESIAFPRSWYITSDTMVDVVHYNDLDETVHIKYLPPDEVKHQQLFLEQLFKNASFPPEIISGLRRVLREVGDKPIIVRSSSLLEDSFGAAFSGKYKSLFLANIGSDRMRLEALVDAIAEVYASTFFSDPIEYRKEKGLLDFSEEMGILIQEVVGNRVGPYFTPAFAGVAFSNNEFRWSPRIRREDGIIRLVAGLGTRAVDRLGDDYPMLVSPKKPDLRVNTVVDEIVRYSQKEMELINMKTGVLETLPSSKVFKEFQEEFPLADDIISVCRGGVLSHPGIQELDERNIVVTFSRLLERSPFINQISKVLDVLKRELGHPVDVEFAHDGESLYILQCRPQSQGLEVERVPVPKNIMENNKLFSAQRYVTTGLVEGVEYIVYVDPGRYEELGSKEDMMDVAATVGKLNAVLPKRKFILMGPGRWGSRGDIKLGVPVTYRDINNTALLVEIAKEKGGYLPELSFGTHFFQDLVEAEIQYLPLYPDESGSVYNDKLLGMGENKLKELVPRAKNDIVRVIRVADIADGGTLSVVMDGDAGKALAYLVPPDHWVWRMEKVNELAAELDAEVMGVHGLYVVGSTKDGTAGPASDIDLIVHFRGTEQQRYGLIGWLEDRGKKLAEENAERTGYQTGDLLDVHIITDEDLEKGTSWASHVTSRYNKAKKIEIGKGK